MSDLYFKATDGARATHGGDYLYRKGRWTRSEPVVPCVSGWHVARNEQVLKWLAPTLWLAEVHPDAEVVGAWDKVVASRIRVVERLDAWNSRTARLFAADCAEDAFALVKNPDLRSVEAVAVARRLADGDATKAELSAARAAAWAAAEDVAWAAERPAARPAERLARAAAEAAERVVAEDDPWTAARAAAGAAAWGAEWGAARAAERAKQYARLLTYLKIGADDE